MAESCEWTSLSVKCYKETKLSFETRSCLWIRSREVLVWCQKSKGESKFRRYLETDVVLNDGGFERRRRRRGSRRRLGDGGQQRRQVFRRRHGLGDLIPRHCLADTVCIRKMIWNCVFLPKFHRLWCVFYSQVFLFFTGAPFASVDGNRFFCSFIGSKNFKIFHNFFSDISKSISRKNYFKQYFNLTPT